MVEKTKEPKKGSITEEDTATLLQRYAPTTVLALLQEVANSPKGKIDWNRLVAKTSTGISNAREYQMLWRHLAYREALLDKLDNGAQPLDDDSDLEYEVEAYPAVSAEASTEAVACVKFHTSILLLHFLCEAGLISAVLISSGLSSDSSHQNGLTVEGLLSMNLPNQSSRSQQNLQPTCSMQGKNFTVPVSVLKNSLPAVTTTTVETAEGDDALGNGMAPRKRRKNWSEAEDLELIAAVQKYGEGNWANMLRGDFKGDRTPSQLAQRWKKIRGNNLDLNVGGSSSKLSEAQLAARHSLSIALNMPNITANTIGTAGTSTHSMLAGTNATSNSLHFTTAEAKPLSQKGLDPVKAEAKPQTQEGLNPAKTYQMGLSGSTTKAPVIAKKTISKLTDSKVRATAVAAGARIAFPSDAASLLKAAQAKNAVHIMPTVCSSTQSVKPGGMSTHSELPPNVHILRSSSVATPLSTPSSTAATPSTTRPRSSKVLPQASQHTPTKDAMLSRQTNGVSCNLDAEQVQDGAVIFRDGPNDQVQKDKGDSPDQKAESKNLSTNAEKPVDTPKILSDETGSKAVTGVQAKEGKSAKDNEIPRSSVNVGASDPSAVDGCENRSASEKQTDLAIETDGCKGKQVLACGKIETGTQPHNTMILTRIAKMPPGQILGIVSFRQYNTPMEPIPGVKSNEFVATPNSEKQRNLFSVMMKTMKKMKNVGLLSIFLLDFKVQPLRKAKKLSFRQSASPRPAHPLKNDGRTDDDIVQVSNELFDHDDNLAAESFAFNRDIDVNQSPRLDVDVDVDVDEDEYFEFPILINNPTSNPTDDPFQKAYSSGGDQHSTDNHSFIQTILGQHLLKSLSFRHRSIPQRHTFPETEKNFAQRRKSSR
ncbi:hypothetical protein C1H46_007490 [Malus baccata]|uniref:Uncharacterized protein n=1 Tax=Malus baccata TaxID=106549 RepID=A0A540N726_MALBA|nr:hypothetical protein C1H46_007490 [Malus baccata]